MATLTIRSFDDDLKDALQRRASVHGRSMEAEARAILGAALHGATEGRGLASRIRTRVDHAGGGVDLPTVARRDLPRAVDLDG